LGTNGRRCVTCHQASDAWTITPPHVQDRFNATHGTDPLFRANDGSGCPTQDVSTEHARRSAYSLLLNKGLIRIELPVPATAEFTVLENLNPYGCNSVTPISAYRRPLPTTNIPYLSTVMWDGRQTLKDANGDFQPITFDLEQQAINATTTHAQGQPPTSEQIQQISTSKPISTPRRRTTTQAISTTMAPRAAHIIFRNKNSSSASTIRWD
jgi:cytochrome c peroxidase